MSKSHLYEQSSVKSVQLRKKTFDLSPIQMEAKTRSGLIISKGRQGIGNMEETDSRIERALKTMIKERQEVLSRSKGGFRRATSTKSILKKSREEHLTTHHVNYSEDQLRQSTQKLLQLPKYKSMASVKSTSEIEFRQAENSKPKKHNKVPYELPEKFINAKVVEELDDLTNALLKTENNENYVELQKTQSRVKNSDTKQLSSICNIPSEDTLFKFSKCDQMEAEKKRILSVLQDKKQKIQTLLSKPRVSIMKADKDMYNGIESKLHLKDPFIEIQKNEIENNFKKVEIVPDVPKQGKHSVNPNIMADIKKERKDRIKYLKAAVDVKEWNFMLQSIKSIQHELFDSVVSEVDCELEFLVDQIIKAELAP